MSQTSSTEISTPAAEIVSALYNAQQFSKGTLAFSAHKNGQFVFYGYDEFTFVQSWFQGNAGEPVWGHLTVDDVKEMQKALVRVEEVWVYHDFENIYLTNSQGVHCAFKFTEPADGAPTADDIQDLAKIHDEVRDMPLDTHVARLAFSPDRFRKLALLKPSGLPLDMRFDSDAGQVVGAFKYGTQTTGLMSFLDRETIREEMGDEHLW